MSSLTTNAKGNMNAIKAKVLKQASLGEKLQTTHFRLRFREDSEIEFRVAATQIPEMMRHEIEGFGAMGTMSNQQGNLKNVGQFTVTIEEYLDAKAATFINKSILEKIYYDIDLALTPEDTNLEPIAEWEMLKCYLNSEAVDVANEDITGTVKFALTITYNWVEKTK